MSDDRHPVRRVSVAQWTTYLLLACLVLEAGSMASRLSERALIAPAVEDRRTRDGVWFDLGQASMSIMLAATDLGIASGHSAVRDRELARKLLGLPSNQEAMYMIALGYPADRPLRPIKNPTRRPFEDVVHRVRW